MLMRGCADTSPASPPRGSRPWCRVSRDVIRTTRVRPGTGYARICALRWSRRRTSARDIEPKAYLDGHHNRGDGLV
jgi:hypothetical protein